MSSNDVIDSFESISNPLDEMDLRVRKTNKQKRLSELEYKELIDENNERIV